MTTTLAVNNANDIFINDIGNLAISDDQQALLEACEQAIQAVRGEMFYASDRGMPHFEVTFTGAPNVLQFEAAARIELLRIEGVTDITSFTAEVVVNTMQYSATIDTIFGTETVTGTIGG